MPTFRPKPVTFDCRQVPTMPDGDVRWDDAAFQAYATEAFALAQWCGGLSYMMHGIPGSILFREGDPGRDHIAVPIPGGPPDDYALAFSGDWIVSGGEGDFYPRSDEFVRTMLDPVEAESLPATVPVPASDIRYWHIILSAACSGNPPLTNLRGQAFVGIEDGVFDHIKAVRDAIAGLLPKDPD